MFETKTEFKVIEKRFGLCIRCKITTACEDGSQNIRIKKTYGLMTSHESFVTYGYDLCTDCIDELLEWMENKNGANQPANEKAS